MIKSARRIRQDLLITQNTLKSTDPRYVYDLATHPLVELMSLRKHPARASNDEN
jgi:hypothetical protein